MKTTEVNLWTLSSLPELQGVKEKQEALVKSNPYVSITDNVSYLKAKRHRTALVTGRTDLNKDKKLIYAKIKKFKEEVVDVATQSLIEITQVHEDKQQEEVKRWEAEKEAEKQARLEKDRKRKEALKAQVIGFRDAKRAAIESATFKTIKAVISDIEETEMNVEEFQEDFHGIKEIVLDEAKKKQAQLVNAEDLRVQRQKQEEERKKLEEERKKLDEEKAAAEKERKEREAKDAAKRKAEDERLAAERKKLEEEKAEIKRQEEERRAKEEAEAKAKKEAKQKAELDRRIEAVKAIGWEYNSDYQWFTFGRCVAIISDIKGDEFDIKEFEKSVRIEKARIEAIKPDKEKLSELLASIEVKNPEVKEQSAIDFFNDFSREINTIINKYKSIITEL